ncbi:MAG: sensor histidine kinase [Bacillota bacterium]
MLFIAMIFLIFALFVVMRVLRGYQAVWLGLILFTFGCCIVGLAGLIPRFGNYQLDGLFSLPLDQPSWAWRLLENLSLYDFMRFRLWSVIGFIIAMVGFAFSYSFKRWNYPDLFWLFFFSLSVVFLGWNFDPEHLYGVYMRGAVLLNNTAARGRWEQQLSVTDIAAFGLIFIILCWSVRRIFLVFFSSSILQKRVQALCVGFGMLVLTVFFILLCCLGRGSVLNEYTMATSLLPLGSKYPVFNSFYLRAIPLATLIAVSMVLLAILRYGFLGTSRIGTQKLDQQINLANQAVRLALHSFKNRFLAVQMAMNMAMMQLKELPGEEVAKARIQIESAVDICTDSLAGLDKLHNQAKRLQVNPHWVCLEELVEAALQNCGCCYSLEGIVLTKRYSTSLIYAWGDYENLVKVLENLIQNALDAFNERPSNGEQPKLLLETGAEYEWGFVRVTDNGPGIPKENLHKVFRPFYTTKPAKTNWGLGLTYCHRVIKAHHGFINLQSKTGTGTRVEVVLRCRENLNTK